MKRHLPRTLFLLACAILPLLCARCSGRQTGSVVSATTEEAEDKEAPYVEGNRKILQWENEEMALFIKRYGWEMQRTGTGLYIQILNPGHGEFFKEGDLVSMSHKTFLLSGEQIYDGTRRFTVAKSEEIAALHEAAQLLRPGAEARLVIPSYLAYGVAGDGDKVNGRLSLAMTIRVSNDTPDNLSNAY